MTPRHTILVVDDEADVVRSVQDLLRLDYRVLGATSAQEGMQILEREEVNVVMTDQRMPEMTGVEFLKSVRGEHPDAIRLLFTGYADIRAVIDAINQGNVYRYITKPWDPDELQSLIRDACQHYDLIVERKRLVSELKQKNEELERINEELRRSGAMKSAFIQVASHELRTPLTILLGLSKLALRAPDAPAFVHDLLERMEGAGLRLQNLVEHLLEMLSAEQLEQVLDCGPVELAGLLRDAGNDVQPFVDLRKQTLSVEAPADLGTVHIDREKIRDCLNHLLLNAIKFTPDGGRITLSAARGGEGTFDIRVSDSGVGIPPENLPHIFKAFFTGFDVARHCSGHYEFGRKGLGLGLSVVKAFVEMHGGSASVQSEVDQGTTFTMRLPTDCRRDRGATLAAERSAGAA